MTATPVERAYVMLKSPPRARPEEQIRVAELADTEGNLITVAEVRT